MSATSSSPPLLSLASDRTSSSSSSRPSPEPTLPLPSFSSPGQCCSSRRRWLPTLLLPLSPPLSSDTGLSASSSLLRLTRPPVICPPRDAAAGLTTSLSSSPRDAAAGPTASLSSSLRIAAAGPKVSLSLRLATLPLDARRCALSALIEPSSHRCIQAFGRWLYFDSCAYVVFLSV
ncbi:putative protein TPRXL [Zingiber officinale]|uniref:putative protein TPRXL n=1 Tax=Zingiber officinale TaxID=94328 RepID=UPI001C4B98D6|nr:putative protein TPRXL [Zingiber officinale]